MDGENQETLATQEVQTSTDPWEMAFAALDKEREKDSEPASDSTDDSAGADNDSEGTNEGEGTAESETGDSDGSTPDLGGQVDLGEEDRGEDAADNGDDYDVSQEALESYRKTVLDDVSNRTINIVAKAYIDKGARHTNGRLGATINDPDICKRDSDGIPHFYNPDTGREFTGDNPRRQAQEWVNDYNEELKNNFNNTCHEYAQKLLKEEMPAIEILEFAPTYVKLDAVRREMFDSIVEDYEIKDKNGEIIGYSCDLNKALEAVNRQVSRIQSLHQASKQEEPKQPSGPVLDMKNSAGATVTPGEKPKFNSLAEAMEWEQDQLLAKQKNKNK